MTATMAPRTLQPGDRVRITQTIRRRDGNWSASVSGEVIEHTAQKTGSWFTHAPQGKLLLNRVRLKKPDGEICLVVLDENSKVEMLDGTSGDSGKNP